MKYTEGGRFTVTAGEASGGKTVTIGFRPTYIKLLVDEDATNPDVIEVFDNGTTASEILTTGSTGVVTVTTNITMTDRGFTIASGALTEGDVNCFLVAR